MKKTLLLLFAAAAFVGCQRREEVTEPSGAERDTTLQPAPSADTNTVSEPAGAQSGSDTNGATGTSGATGTEGTNGATNP